MILLKHVHASHHLINQHIYYEILDTALDWSWTYLY